MLSIFCSASISEGQILFEKLSLLIKFNKWLLSGHYANPEDSHYLHKLRFDFILDGHTLVLSKEVTELNFEMETTFYWNHEFQQIVFQSLSNKGQVSNGFVSVEPGRIILTGENIDKAKKSKFKQIFELFDNNRISDKFYLMINGEWFQRHLIYYEYSK